MVNFFVGYDGEMVISGLSHYRHFSCAQTFGRISRRDHDSDIVATPPR
jgi:hypothetical protein